MNNILMNAEMTKAILDSCKNQTRRIIDTKNMKMSEIGLQKDLIQFAKYKKGETIWVGEPVKVDMCFTEEIHFHYLAENATSKLGIPKRFIKDGFIVDWMAHCNGVPNGCIKEMARIFLKITNVRVERLQDITYEDILKEGFPIDSYEMKDISKLYSNDTHGEINFEEDRALEWWIGTWNKTAPKGYEWDDNPDVFVCEFKRVNKDGSDT